MSAEMVRERDIWHRDRRTREEYERDFKAYARREAREDVLRVLDFYLHREVSAELTSLAYHLSQLPDGRLKGSDLYFIRTAATDLTDRIAKWRTEQVPQLAELRRLHEAAEMAGRRLHDRFGPDHDELGYCRCPGCELSRDLENTPAAPGAAYRLLRRRILPTEQREARWSPLPEPSFDTPGEAAAALRQLRHEQPDFEHRYELTAAQAPNEQTPTRAEPTRCPRTSPGRPTRTARFRTETLKHTIEEP